MENLLAVSSFFSFLSIILNIMMFIHIYKNNEDINRYSTITRNLVSDLKFAIHERLMDIEVSLRNLNVRIQNIEVHASFDDEKTVVQQNNVVQEIVDKIKKENR